MWAQRATQSLSRSTVVKTTNDYVESVREIRTMYVRSGDETGTHLCDVALVQAARYDGPIAVLNAVGVPLNRMIQSRTLFGVELLGLELLGAGLALEADDLVRDVAKLIGRSGRTEVINPVITGLITLANAENQQQRAKRAHKALRAAVNVAVAAGHYEGGATAMEALAQFHLSREEQAPAVVCLEQASLYAQRAGLETWAADLTLAAREYSPKDEPEALHQAAQAYRRGGNLEQGIEAALAYAQAANDKAKVRKALSLLQAFIEDVGQRDDQAIEAQLHEHSATLCDQLNDDVMAESHRARAELIALFDGE